MEKDLADRERLVASTAIGTPGPLNKRRGNRNVNKLIVKIEDIAAKLGMQKEEVALPNGKKVLSLVWKPEHLTRVFEVCDAAREGEGVGKNDVVVVDGVAPTWLIPTITHAFHPSATALAYPQGGPDSTLPISGVQTEGAGQAENVSFKVTEGENETTVEFTLSQPNIDAPATLASLVAPAVPNGKPVRVTGRGPTAIAAALAEAYAHRVPYVALFQPGTGFVVSISHSNTRLGTIVG